MLHSLLRGLALSLSAFLPIEIDRQERQLRFERYRQIQVRGYLLRV